jgi:hypothetical protein
MDDEMGETCSTHWGSEMRTKFYSQGIRRKETPGKPTSKLEYNINMDFKETVCKGADWIHLTQDRVHLRAQWTR